MKKDGSKTACGVALSKALEDLVKWKNRVDRYQRSFRRNHRVLTTAFDQRDQVEGASRGRAEASDEPFDIALFNGCVV